MPKVLHHVLRYLTNNKTQEVHSLELFVETIFQLISTWPFDPPNGGHSKVLDKQAANVCVIWRDFPYNTVDGSEILHQCVLTISCTNEGLYGISEPTINNSSAWIVLGFPGAIPSKTLVSWWKLTYPAPERPG